MKAGKKFGQTALDEPLFFYFRPIKFFYYTPWVSTRGVFLFSARKCTSKLLSTCVSTLKNSKI